MKLEDCVTKGNMVAVSAPITRNEPERDWVEAKNSGIIPPEVFFLYELARFLSFGSAPKFLSDNTNFLFAYFSMILESVKGSLIDADQEANAFIEATTMIFDLGKEKRGEPWDDAASGRAKNHFRMFVISLCASLDATAELVALLLTDQIPGLRIGKADFQKIEDWLKKPLPPPKGLIVSPQRSRLIDLHRNLRPLVAPSGPEKDWLPLMRTFRNKAAHLSTNHFREIGFADTTGRFHRFFPRRWPLLWEEHISLRSEIESGQEGLGVILRQLMSQDNVSYVRGLHAKMKMLLGTAFGILGTAYRDFKDFEPNNRAFEQLQKNIEVFEFERFDETL